MRMWSWLCGDDYTSRLGIAQRAAHQRLMLLAYAIIIPLASLFAIYIHSLGSTEVVEPVKTFHIQSKAPTRELRPARTSLPRWQPYKHHRGFMGFVGGGVRIVPEARETGVATIPEATIHATLDLETDGDFSYSPTLGDDAGVFGPGADDYTASLPACALDTLFLWNRRVTRSIGVAHVEHPEYPRIARRFGARQEGSVTVLVLIDHTGAMIPFSYKNGEDSGYPDIHVLGDGKDTTLTLLVKEDPKGWWFYEKLKLALPKWVFAPAIRDGSPVDRVLEITYRYCADPNCIALKVKQLQSGVYQYPTHLIRIDSPSARLEQTDEP